MTPEQVGNTVQRWTDSNESYAILDKFGADTWQAGGCSVLAISLYELFDGAQIQLIESRDRSGQWRPEHMAIEMGGLIVDSMGARTPEEFLSYWSGEPMCGTEGVRLRPISFETAYALAEVWLDPEDVGRQLDRVTHELLMLFGE